MQVSIEWLNELVDLSDITPEQIAHELTMAGLEVEEIETTGAKFTNIVVAEIKDLKPHPNADKLRLVTVFNGTETKEVVCGAQNIEVGQVIPYASVGSQVLDRKTGETYTLKPAKIRDVESQGMLCSADELGLNTSDYQEEDGILVLNRFLTDLTLGDDVKTVLNISEETIIHVAPTANRGDLMSVSGIARELAAIFNKKLKFSHIENHNESKADFNVEIHDLDTCKYYAAGILKNIKIGKSPDWMQRRLVASGVRAINNVVDVTNYVMLEYGQPLHAFDLNKLNENYLCVRRANETETMVTLDETERKLTTESVLIATKNSPVALAGLMGGLNSEVDENTTELALESAYFVPVTTRRSARSVGHRTDASARFERGVDIGAVKPALIRAIQLLIEHAGAEFSGISEVGENKLPEIEITLRFSEVKRILGAEIPETSCVQILENLGFEVLGRNSFSAKFLVPSFRANDVTREIDLIEEISRIYGFDKIEPTLPAKTQAPEISKETKLLKQINNFFIGNGFNEIMTSSLTGEPLLKWIGLDYNKEQAVKVNNAHSDDHTMLRQNLIPSIMQVTKGNLDNGQKDLWLYEIGKTYFAKETPTPNESGVQEKRILAGVISGNIRSGLWKGQTEVDFYSLKGILETFFSMLGLESRVEYSAEENIAYFHPGRTAKVTLLGKGMPTIATFGQLHPETKSKCKISQQVFVFEIDLETILENVNMTTQKFKLLPQFPEVSRDLAFVLPINVTHQEIVKVIKKASTTLFRGVDVFDVYQGENIQEGFKSTAYRITLQDEKATLTDEIVEAETEKIRTGLKKAFSELSFRA